MNILILVIGGIISGCIAYYGFSGQSLEYYKKKRMETEQSYLKSKMIWLLKSDIICAIIIFVSPAVIGVIWGEIWGLAFFVILGSGFFAFRNRNGIDW